MTLDQDARKRVLELHIRQCDEAAAKLDELLKAPCLLDEVEARKQKVQLSKARGACLRR